MSSPNEQPHEAPKVEPTPHAPEGEATGTLPASSGEARRVRASSDKPGFRARQRARRDERLGRSSALRLTRISPWRATAIALVYSIVVAMVMEGLVYFVWRAFDAAGVFTKLIEAVSPTGTDSAQTLESWFTLEKFLTVGGVFSASLILIIPMGVFFTVLVYNFSAKLMGGVRLTLMGDRQRRKA